MLLTELGRHAHVHVTTKVARRTALLVEGLRAGQEPDAASPSSGPGGPRDAASSAPHRHSRGPLLLELEGAARSHARPTPFHEFLLGPLELHQPLETRPVIQGGNGLRPSFILQNLNLDLSIPAGAQDELPRNNSRQVADLRLVVFHVVQFRHAVDEPHGHVPRGRAYDEAGLGPVKTACGYLALLQGGVAVRFSLCEFAFEDVVVAAASRGRSF